MIPELSEMSNGVFEPVILFLQIVVLVIQFSFSGFFYVQERGREGVFERVRHML